MGKKCKRNVSELLAKVGLEKQKASQKMLKDRRFALVCRILQSHHLPSHAAQLFHNKWQHLPTFPASQISEGLNWYIPTQRENFQVGAKKNQVPIMNIPVSVQLCPICHFKTDYSALFGKNVLLIITNV